MDIDNHIHLRSFVKSDVTPILKAVVIALLIHLLLLINWFSNNEIEPVEIPQWINVKLTAGFETISTKPKTQEKQHDSPKKKENSQKRKTEIQPLTKKITSAEKKQKALTKATTFIMADSQPYTLLNEKPVYPSAARRRGMQGIVLLSIKVNEKGFVEYVNIEKTSGFRMLDQSAVRSVSKWQFVPAKKENEFVSSVVELPIRFHLNDV